MKIKMEKNMKNKIWYYKIILNSGHILYGYNIKDGKTETLEQELYKFTCTQQYHSIDVFTSMYQHVNGICYDNSIIYIRANQIACIEINEGIKEDNIIIDY